MITSKNPDSNFMMVIYEIIFRFSVLNSKTPDSDSYVFILAKNQNFRKLYVTLLLYQFSRVYHNPSWFSTGGIISSSGVINLF